MLIQFRKCYIHVSSATSLCKAIAHHQYPAVPLDQSKTCKYMGDVNKTVVKIITRSDLRTTVMLVFFITLVVLPLYMMVMGIIKQNFIFTTSMIQFHLSSLHILTLKTALCAVMAPYVTDSGSATHASCLVLGRWRVQYLYFDGICRCHKFSFCLVHHMAIFSCLFMATIHFIA